MTKVVEGITKAAAMLAVFGSLSGYLSLRMHLNTLGISTQTPLETARYLAELPAIVYSALGPPLALGLPLAVLTSIATGGFFLMRRANLTRSWRFHQAVFTALDSMEAPLIVTAILFFLGWKVQNALNACGEASIGLAVGQLSVYKKPESGLLFFLAFYACAAGYLICRSGRKLAEKRNVIRSRLWLLPMALIALIGLQLPVLYGRSLHNSEYLKTQITVAPNTGPGKEEKICGLMLFETNSERLLWQAQNKTGKIRIIPKSQIKEVITGESADLWELVACAAQNHPISLCPAGIEEGVK